MIRIRELGRTEIPQIWSIDRREVIDQVYYFENGILVLKPEHYDMQDWPPGEGEKYTPLLYECFDRGGWFCGAFEGNRLVGIAILDSKLIGKERDQLQLKFLHVSRDYRSKGLGKQLFELSQAKARDLGARRMYISATPSEHTVNFYLRLGAVVAAAPDRELFALEPEDIHLECDV